MPPPCSICCSPQRSEIETALRSGESASKVAKKFGIPETNLRRHQAKHDPDLLTDSKHARASTFLKHLDEQLREVKRMQTQARGQGDTKIELALSKEVTRILELRTKAEGELRGQAPGLRVTLDDSTARRIAEAYLERACRRELKSNEQKNHVVDTSQPG